jgi:hypothetical protein
VAVRLARVGSLDGCRRLNHGGGQTGAECEDKESHPTPSFHAPSLSSKRPSWRTLSLPVDLAPVCAGTCLILLPVDGLRSIVPIVF